MENTTQRTHYSVGKRALSIFLSLLMVAGVFVMDWSGLIRLSPTADAAEGAADYTWSVSLTTSDDVDTWDADSYVILYWKTNNGYGSEGSAHVLDYNAFQNTGTHTASNSTYNIPDGAVPYKIQIHLRFAALPFRNWKGSVSFSSNMGSTSASQWEWKSSWSGGNTETKDLSISGTWPYVNSVTLTNPDHVDIPSTSGTTASTTVSEVKDQYGVKWQNPYFVWYSDTGTTYQSGDGTTTGSFKVKYNNGADYTGKTKVRVYCNGSANGDNWDFTKSFTVHDYLSLTVDANGGSYSGTTPVYGHNNACSNLSDGTVSLSKPTRTGYTFAGWTVSGGGSVTSGTGNETYTFGNKNGVVTAKWTPKTWNVIFHGNGNTSGSMSNQGYESGTAQKLTANAFGRSHTVTFHYNNADDYNAGTANTTGTVSYDFQGWSTSNSSTASTSGDTTTIGGSVAYANQYNLNLARESDLNLYAVWKTTTNYVTAPTPTRNGYTFDKWYSVQSGDSFSGDSYGSGAKIQPVTANKDFYAKWNINRYTITYTDSKATILPNAAGTANYYINAATTEGAVTALKTPDAKPGYAFAGWKCTTASGNWTANTVYAAGTNVAGKYGNPTLEAQWTANEYNIVFDSNEPAVTAGTATGMPANTTKKVGEDKTISSTVPALTGYTFGGWDIYAGDTYKGHIGAGGTITEDYVTTAGATITLKAVWTPNTYTVHFNGNGATGGTTGDENGKQGFTYDVEQALSPNHFERKYTITYNANGGTVSPASEDASYTFDGWATSETGAKVYNPGEEVVNLAPSGTFELYAHWDNASAAKTLPTPTRDGYTFKGWHVGTVSGAAAASPYTPTSDVTLVAEWEPIPYTATFDPDGGTVTPATSDFTIEDALALPTPTKTGYTFTGWKVTTAAGNWAANVQFEATDTSVPAGKWGDVTLTAQWTPDPFTVHFVGTNATSGSMQDQGFLYSDNKALSSNGFNRTYTVTFDENYEGKLNPMATATSTYAIDGWATSEGGAKVYGDAETVAGSALYPGKNGTKNLYIVWKDGDVTLAGGNRAGYYIEGWYRTVSGSTYSDKVGVPGDTYKPTQSETLYAKWEPIKYNVEYNGNGNTGGTAPASHADIIYNQEITVAANTFEKTGYHFTGWNTKADGTGTPYNANQTASNLMTVAGTLTLYAQWAPDTYTVTYYYNYTGASPASSNESVTFDGPWPTVATPERAGYEFAGWYDEAACENATNMSGNYTIPRNKNVYAKWTPKTYTAHFNGNGGTNPNDATFTTATSLALPTSTRTGYTFKGWKVTAAEGNWTQDLVYTGSSVPAGKYGNVTFTAEWKAIEYTITYDNNGATTSVTAPTKYTIESEDALGEPVRNGYTFDGWLASEAADGTAWTNGNKYAAGTALSGKYGNVKLTAQWKPVPYTITYTDSVASGDSAAGTDTYNPDNTEGKVLKTPTKVGYIFQGWKVITTDAVSAWTNTSYSEGTSLTGKYGNVTLEAQWTARSYQITFNGNAPAGETVSGSVTPQTVTYDQSFTLNENNFSVIGYTFLGWSTQSGATVQEYADKANLTNELYDEGRNVTLYAIWQRNQSKVTVYKEKTATGFGEVILNEQSGLSGTTITLNPGTKDGYTFDHWEFEGAHKGSVSGNDYTYGPDADTEDVIYGVWTPITYTITYNANKPATATGTVTGMPEGSITKTYDQNQNVSNAVPTLAGWTFAGWKTQDETPVRSYQPGDTIDVDFRTELPAADVILYAQWTQNESTVEVYKEKVNGVLTTKLDEQTRKSGTTIDVNAGTKTGYHFTGWAFEGTVYGSLADATLAATTYTFGNDDGVTAKIYGTWEADSYTVTFNANAPAGKTATGSVPDLTNQRYDSAVTLNTNNYVVDGYTFLGWAKTAAATAATYEDGATVTDNSLYPNANNGTMTLYAIWVQNESTLNLNLNGGSGIDPTSITQKSGTTYTVPTPTAPEGMVFTGWQKSDPFKGTLTGTTYTFPNDAGNVDTLTAQYAYKTITVTYQYGETPDATNDKTVSGDYSQTLNHLTAAGFTTKTGYTLKGWAETAGSTTVKYALGSEIAKSLYGDGAATAITVFAIWEINKSTLTVDPNGGTWNNTTAVSNIEGEYNTTYTVTPDPTRDGYTFTGWAQSGENGSFNATSKVYTYGENTGDGLTLTAQWSANTYNIVFHDTESDQTNTQANVVYDTEGGITLKDVVFTKEGYHMIGWATAENGDKVYDLKAQLAKAQMNALLLTADSDRNVHLWVVWEINKSKVTVYKDTDPETKLYNEREGQFGQEIDVTLGDYTKTGFTFGGWAFDGESHNGTLTNASSATGAKYTYGAAAASSDIVKAVWNENHYNVKYYYNATDNNFDPKTDPSIGYTEDYTIKGEALFGNRVGYTLVGWATTATATTAEYTPNQVVKNLRANDGDTIELYAIWQLDVNHVTLIVPDGSGYEAKADETKDITYRQTQTFTVTLDAAHDRTPVTELTATVVGHGTVSFAKNGATVTVTVLSTGEGDITVTLGDAKLNNYTVTLVDKEGDNWNSDVNGYDKPEVVSSVAHDGTVTFTVTLKEAFSDTAAADLIDSVTMGGSTKAYTVDGYTFTIANVTGDLVITLKNAEKNKSQVEFDANGGTITVDGVASGVYNVKDKTAGETVTVPDPEKTGYTFTGWLRDPSSTGNGTLEGSTYTFGTRAAKDVYKAQWTAKQFTVTFSQETAAGDPDWAVITKGTLSKPVTFDGEMPTIDNLPTRVGYDFLGYTVTDGGTDYRYNASGALVGENKYTVNGNQTLYAKWEKHVYTITSNTPDGYAVTNPGSAYYNDAKDVTVTANAEYDINKVTVTVTGDAQYTTEIVNGQFIVHLTDIHSNVEVAFNGEKVSYEVKAVFTNGSAFETDPPVVTLLSGETATLEFTVKDGYQNTVPTVVTDPNGVQYTIVKKDGTDRTFVITSANILQNTTFTVTAVENTYHAILVSAGEGLTVTDGAQKDIAYLGTLTNAFTLTLDADHDQTTVADLPVTVENGTAVVAIENGVVTISVTSTTPGDVRVTVGNAKENVYDLTFVNNAGASVTLNAPVLATNSTVKASDTVTFSVTVNAGYTASAPTLTTEDGATIASSREGNVVTFTVSGFKKNTTITLNPAEKNTSTLNVVLDGGTLAGVEASYTKAFGDTQALGVPTKTGYTFLGWSLNDNANGSVVTAADKSVTYTFGTENGVTDTLTATWAPNTYKIIYKYNVEGVTVADVTDDIVFDTNLTLRGDGTFVREGWTLKGWTTVPGGETVQKALDEDLGTYTTAADTTYYAVWKVHSSTLAINLNDTEADRATWNNTDERSFTQDYTSTKEIPDPVRTGYVFKGWTQTGSNGTFNAETKTYTFGKTDGVTDTLTANWDPAKYAIVYHYNVSGDTRTESQEVTYNEAVTLQGAIFTRTGYTLAGWATASDATAPDYELSAAYTDAYRVAHNTDLYAVWTPDVSTVEIYSDAGVLDRTVTGTVESEPAAINNNFSKTGYHFVKWDVVGEARVSDVNDLNATFTFGPTKNAVTKITAVWAPDTYTVTFVKNDGTADQAEKNVTFDAAWPTAPVYSRDGYTFGGWYYEDGSEEHPFEHEETFGENYATDRNTTLYAKWNIHTSTVEIDVNGGTTTQTPLSYTQDYNTTLTLVTPTRNGYRFTGWTLNENANGTISGSVYTFGKADGANDVLTAQWEALTFTVTFHKNDGTGAKEAVTVTFDDAFPTMPTFVREGYTFNHWTEDAAGETAFTAPATFNYNPARSIDVYAQWTPNQSTVEIYSDAGVPDRTVTGTVESEPAAINNNFSKTGYHFVKWNVEGEAQVSDVNSINATFTFGPTKDAVTKITAVWAPDTYTVTFVKNDGTADQAEKPVTYDAAWPAAPVYSRDGYTFGGWYYEDGSEAHPFEHEETFGENYDTDGNTTLYAKWNIHTSTVEIDANGGTTTLNASYTQNYGTTLTLDTPTRNGYRFTGWTLNDNANGTLSGMTYTFGPKDKTEDGYTADVITAQWEALTYTVTFHKNDGTGAKETFTVAFDDTFPTAPTFTRDGYTFDKWTVEAAADSAVFTAPATFNYDPAKNVDVYAQWTIHQSKVELELDGGSNGMEASYTQNYNTTLTLIAPTKLGYTFAGWTLTGKNGDANGSLSGSTYTFGKADGATDVLTANWTKNTYTIIYHNGTETKNQTATYDEVLTLLGSDTFTKTGYTLAGWARTDGVTTADGVTDAFGKQFKDETLNALYVDETRTFDLYAVWTLNTYNLTLNSGEGYALTSENVTSIDYLGTVTYTFELDDEHSQTLPADISVTKTPNADVTLTKEGSVITVTVRSTDVGDIEVTLGNAKVNTYTVTFVNEAGETVNLVAAPAGTVAWNHGVTVEITLPAAYSATDLNALVTSTGSVSVSHALAEGGKIVYAVSGIKEDITVTLHEAVRNTYTVKAEIPEDAHYTIDETEYTGVVHGEDRTFTITLNEAYSDSAAPAAVLKEGENKATLILPTAKVGNTYTYTLHNVTGNTTLQLADAEINTYTVDLSATKVGYTVTSAESFADVEYGDTRVFRIKLDEAFSATTAITASLSNDKAALTVSGPDAEGVFTYTVANVKGNVTLILGDATRNTYDVTFAKGSDVVGIASFTPASVTVEHGTGTATLKITLEDAYSDSDAPAVTLADGSAEISGGVKSVVDGKTVYTYTVTNVTEASSFTIGSANPNKYIVSFDATRVGYTVTEAPASFVYYQGTATAKITLADGFSETDENAIPFTVTEGTYATKSVSRTGNVITFTVTGITANTAINIGSATINKYDVELVADGTGYSVTGDPSGTDVVEHGGSKTVEITLATAYSESPIPAITVKNANGVDIGSAIGSKVGSVITYTITNITDDVIITVGPATMNTYTVAVRPGDGSPIRLTSVDGIQDFTTSTDLLNVPYGKQYTVSMADAASTAKLYVDGAEVTPGTTITITKNTVISTDAQEYIATFLHFDRTYWASYIVVRNNYAQCFKGIPERADSTYHHYVFDQWVCDDPNVTLNTPMTEDRVFVATYTTYHQNLELRHDENGHWYECPECGYTEGYSEHIAGETVIENRVAPTCTSTGGHDEVVYCSVCNEELSRTYVFEDYDFNNHTDPDTHEPNETYRVTLYDATCVDTGLIGIYCVKCNGLVGTEEIPVNPEHHHWSSYTRTDDDTHSRTCELCGAVESQKHVLREVYRVSATCVDDGETMYGCTVCGTQVNKVRPATGEHLAGDTYTENYVPATCQTKAEWDEATYCVICGLELSRVHRIGELGEHHYELVDGSEVIPATCTGTYHAEYKCSVCGDTYEVNETGEHDWSGWTVTVPVTATTDGKEERVCAVCGEKEERTISHDTFKPMGERQVQFIEQDGVTYSMIDYKTKEETTVSGYVKYYSNVDFQFKVSVNNRFSYRGYTVYVNDQEVTADGNGVYTVKAGVDTIHIKVAGVSPINTGDNGNSGSGANAGSNSGSCPYCHQNHTGFFGGIVGFFHRIAYFFSHLFNR